MRFNARSVPSSSRNDKSCAVALPSSTTTIERAQENPMRCKKRVKWRTPFWREFARDARKRTNVAPASVTPCEALLALQLTQQGLRKMDNNLKQSEVMIA